MKTEREIEERLVEIDEEIENEGDFHELCAEREALEWVLRVD